MRYDLFWFVFVLIFITWVFQSLFISQKHASCRHVLGFFFIYSSFFIILTFTFTHSRTLHKILVRSHDSPIFSHWVPYTYTVSIGVNPYQFRLLLLLLIFISHLSISSDSFAVCQLILRYTKSVIRVQMNCCPNLNDNLVQCWK